MTGRRLKECVVLGRRVLKVKQKADLFGPALLFPSIRRQLPYTAFPAAEAPETSSNLPVRTS